MGILLWNHRWMLLEYLLGIFFCKKSTNFLLFILYCPSAFYSSLLDWGGSNFINSTRVKLQNHSLLSPCTNRSWKRNDSSELWCSLAESSICPSLSTPFIPPHCLPQGAVVSCISRSSSYSRGILFSSICGKYLERWRRCFHERLRLLPLFMSRDVGRGAREHGVTEPAAGFRCRWQVPREHCGPAQR